jgi:ATP-dependent helicase Lhr and Lhr-like helicase
LRAPGMPRVLCPAPWPPGFVIMETPKLTLRVDLGSGRALGPGKIRLLEARGEIRGGRFVAGFSGEQYALPGAVSLLRRKRRERDTDQWVSISGADPLNLVGILTPGLRLPALTGNRVVYRDGIPVAILVGGKIQFLVSLDEGTQWEAQKRLMRTPAPRMTADLA